MEGMLVNASDPFLKGLGTQRSKRLAERHAHALLTRPAVREKCTRIYTTWIGYFERHLEYPFLWANDPLEVEYFLLALEAHAAYIPRGAFPAIEQAITRLKDIITRSRQDRERHLPQQKIIRLAQFQKAP
ncbi:hypothetical protein HY629_02290 [Candidatus Uhrbacteria bacterium]|nr:hypothetical protein [Candidatus Uhrbacteria bacterium]